jgi:hypothetical protein
MSYERHVSYERAPLRGYIYRPSFVIVISYSYYSYLIYIYIYYLLSLWISLYSKYFGYLHSEPGWFTTQMGLVIHQVALGWTCS